MFNEWLAAPPLLARSYVFVISDPVGSVTLVPHSVHRLTGRGPILGLLNSIQTLGAITALPIIGFLADRLGRRRTIALGAAWTLVGAVLQGSAKHIAAFLIARFLIGWGLAYTVAASPLLLAELALALPRRHWRLILG
jgi:MFS family permease